MTSPTCPCRAGSTPARPYADCCGRWHAGAPAPDAEALMRARYSAYVLDRTDWLLATWHPTTRPATLEPNPPGLRWLGLDVRRHLQDDPDHARVEFVARHKLAGRAQRIQEFSRFVREHGTWLYLDAQADPKPPAPTKPSPDRPATPQASGHAK